MLEFPVVLRVEVTGHDAEVTFDCSKHLAGDNFTVCGEHTVGNTKVSHAASII